MPDFKIKKFTDKYGRSDLVDWHNNLDQKGKAKFTVLIEYLCAFNNPIEWPVKYCRPLQSGISEIRFKSKRVQQRPLGYFGPNIKEYTFLYPATEKGGKFVPEDAVNRAIDRKEIVEGDPRRSDEWDIKII